MRTAILIGHTKNSPGACSPHGLPCEFDFNKSIAIAAAKKNCGITVFENGSYDKGYYEMTKATAKELNEFKPDLILELHYNAADPSAHGSEALYYFKNKKTKALGYYFTKLLQLHMGYRDRGAKALVNKNDRGYWSVFLPDAPSLILEPFFGSNKSDVQRMNKDKYIDVILKTIKYYETIK
ncbi:N-acetylmuramoyl-L-alanine amidase [Cellulophaga phage phi18:2]|uniref:N-acetylmuramoyl-L-alanine amidase n=2 Tax=Cellulophaga phage phi18:1 TaxID=1327982 RepID=S0A321_9CAUD|nr:endolysin [Cellulophaga phage phi18:1]AGO48511.1 N-acetylmuramoyl-L-alanine amidase [Cellulophaga phage phi18:1]AGO49225.1 N-acetylmuramoyl-L-alanine amidase [Cellulophaga phage phi18:2]